MKFIVSYIYVSLDVIIMLTLHLWLFNFISCSGKKPVAREEREVQDPGRKVKKGEEKHREKEIQMKQKKTIKENAKEIKEKQVILICLFFLVCWLI